MKYYEVKAYSKTGIYAVRVLAQSEREAIRIAKPTLKSMARSAQLHGFTAYLD